MALRVFAIWVVLALLAIANGILRETVLHPHMGAQSAHVVSTLVLCALILAVSVGSLETLAIRTLRSALIIGSVWGVLTLAFEIFGGHYLFGAPWSQIWGDYNLAAGRTWIFVPLATIFGPALALRWHRSGQNGA